MFQLGVIGGMGPLATCDFVNRVVLYTAANNDQEHISVCVLNASYIPDRTKAILNAGKSPVVEINKCFSQLSKIGVNFVVIPCNTAHYFSDEFIYSSDMIFLNMIEETGKFLGKYTCDRKVFILGTEGVSRSKIYDKSIKESVVCYPNDSEQMEISTLIIKIKSGFTHKTLRNIFTNLLERINTRVNGCIFLIACTELSGFYDITSEKYQCFDTMDILAISTIKKCGHEIKNDSIPKCYINNQDNPTTVAY